MEVVSGRYSNDPATALRLQPKSIAHRHWSLTASVGLPLLFGCNCRPATDSQLQHMSGGGEAQFESPPTSPSYSPQPSSDSEEDEDVANDDAGGPGWWTDEALAQRERERVERCIYLANAAHKELESVLPEDICPTLETVLGYTEFVSLGNWHLFESDVHAHARIVENFLLPQGNN